MTKQEEIREGLIAKVKSIRLWRTIYDDPLTPEEDADDILRTLDSQGVVIKVEDNSFVAECLRDSWEEIKQDMKEAGYEATESLI